ncbi:hypothetical protein L5515_011811 [Caenorhabditis briggsae]|uniref:Ras-related protein Rab-43 n=1 Tax=Caenorhabditis briggsae TaxID=6238 RepID=A0AAE9JI41_CAEBR|nr:hypothetical protein L5515_011811 [Caenorhabditis briggsae]
MLKQAVRNVSSSKRILLASTATTTDSANLSPILPQNRSFVFEVPQVSVPTFEFSRRVGNIFAQSFYTFCFEKNFTVESLVHGANRGIHSMSHFFADEKWEQMENLAVKDTVENLRFARKGLSKKLESALRFSPDDIVLSFLHSSVISGRDVLKLSQSHNIGIYFTVVSLVPEWKIQKRCTCLQCNVFSSSQPIRNMENNQRELLFAKLVENVLCIQKNQQLGVYMDSDDGFDYLFKIVLVGDMGVGKTCVVQRFRSGNFVDRQGTTIGVDFTMKTLNVDGKRVKLQIWDTGGQERFRTITQSYYRSANGIVLCYDITCKQSFGSLQRWIDDVSKFAAPNVAKLLIGTKCDLEDQRAIETEEAELLQRANGMFEMLETSAKNDINVDNAFLELATILKRQYDQGVVEQGASGTFQLGSGGTTSINSPWQRCCQYA